MRTHYHSLSPHLQLATILSGVKYHENPQILWPIYISSVSIIPNTHPEQEELHTVPLSLSLEHNSPHI